MIVLNDDDIALLQSMASDYERRADDFASAEASMRTRLDDPGDLGVLNSRDMVADFLRSYERRRVEAMRKASVLRRIASLATEAIDG